VIADSDDENVTLTALAIMKLADLLLQNNIGLITQIGKNKIQSFGIVVSLK
jgi:hypothetical protein